MTTKGDQDMKRMIFVLSFALVSAMSAGAQTKTQATTPGAAQSNAPASAPAASTNGQGKSHAAHVAKKKKGTKKSAQTNKANVAPASTK
jgi:hypothetical protein